MITTERNVFVGAHITADQKTQFRAEADRRQMSMSELVAWIIAEFLIIAPDMQVEPKRSNKKVPKDKTIDGLKDVPLPLGE